MRLLKSGWLTLHAASILALGALAAATGNSVLSPIRVSRFSVSRPVERVALSPDADAVLGGTFRSGQYDLWSRDGHLIGSRAAPRAAARFHFLDRKRLLLSSDDATALVWDAASDTLTRRRDIGLSPVISPDRSHVLTGSTGTKAFTIVDLETGASKRLAGEIDAPPRFTPNGRKLFALPRGGGRLRFWDRRTGDDIPVPPHLAMGDLVAADISPDGTLLAAARKDGGIVFVPMLFGDSRLVPPPRRSGLGHIYGVRFSDSDRQLVVYGEAGPGRTPSNRVYQVFDVYDPRRDDTTVRPGYPVQITHNGTCLVVWERNPGPTPLRAALQRDGDRKYLFDARTRKPWKVPRGRFDDLWNLSEDGRFLVTASQTPSRPPSPGRSEPVSAIVTVYAMRQN